MNKRWCAAVWLCVAALHSHAAQPEAQLSGRNWFTVSGDPARPNTETVQVDPRALSPQGDLRTMLIRVNRAQERRNWDNEPYRSYESTVRVDCRSRKAYYLDATFYMEPLWQGQAHLAETYAQKLPPMLFKGMNPNPTERIIRAACGAGG